MALVVCCFAAGCTSTLPPDSATPPRAEASTTAVPAMGPAAAGSRAGGDWGLLIFGDHGYDLRYLERDDYEPPLDWDAFVAKEREEWLEDKRPAAEFEPPAATNAPRSSSFWKMVTVWSRRSAVR